jgi:predicted nucleotidyltransferase
MAEELTRIAETIAELRVLISQQYRAEVVGVFGSYARGEQTAGSDVDVLVNFRPGATLFDLVGLADFLEERLNLRVDVVPVDTLRAEIREQVLKEALPL